ncbi:hypothetical protein VHA01S_046_00110 [Vibrio halioticoli NBRC 102217]|uniref:DUF2796 domain-containing protein n=2 Tax=Vibrio halioticoli TaxID=71388 RepID=V5FNZ6_9VIBR|nr:hypothetical protein [Vibrio halioticoli]GAD90502.1 hypothetical protein VHA01S_046_00110 [Vibrio halioticoli NBRC 102217]
MKNIVNPMKKAVKPFIIICSLLAPTFALADGHNHSHNFFNPKLEQLGNDIIGLTVCYKNGYLSDAEQEPVFENLIEYAQVSGEELGLFYMDRLGQKAEEIMSDEQGRQIWDQTYCAELTDSFLDTDKLAQKSMHNEAHHHHHDDHHSHSHDHGHSHGHHNENIDPETAQQDLERGRLLSIQ